MFFDGMKRKESTSNNQISGVKNLYFNIFQLVKKSSSGNVYVIGNETNDKQEYKLNLIK